MDKRSSRLIGAHDLLSATVLDLDLAKVPGPDEANEAGGLRGDILSPVIGQVQLGQCAGRELDS